MTEDDTFHDEELVNQMDLTVGGQHGLG